MKLSVEIDYDDRLEASLSDCCGRYVIYDQEPIKMREEQKKVLE